MMLPYALLQVLHCILTFKWQIAQLEIALCINTLNTTLYPSTETHKTICLTNNMNLSLNELNGIRNPFNVKYVNKHEVRGKKKDHTHPCSQYIGKVFSLKLFADLGFEKPPRLLG